MKRTAILIGIAIVIGIIAGVQHSRKAGRSAAGELRGAPAPTKLHCTACDFSIELAADEAGEYMKFIPAKPTDEGMVMQCKECGKFGLMQIFPGDPVAQ